MPLMFKLLLDDFSIQKQNCKRNLVEHFGFCNLEMLFALLVEPIAIYMQITIVKFWKTSVKTSFLWF